MSHLHIKRSEVENLLHWIEKNEKEDHSLRLSSRDKEALSTLPPLAKIDALRCFIRGKGYDVFTFKVMDAIHWMR